MKSSKSACVKAKFCRLFSFKAIPYVMLVLIIAMSVFPDFKVALVFSTFFYLITVLTQFSAAEKCLERCRKQSPTS